MEKIVAQPKIAAIRVDSALPPACRSADYELHSTDVSMCVLKEIEIPVDRRHPTPEAEYLLELTRDIADRELAHLVDEYEQTESCPSGLFATLGDAGPLGLPFSEELGGGGKPHVVYLQMIEVLASQPSPAGLSETMTATASPGLWPGSLTAVAPTSAPSSPTRARGGAAYRAFSPRGREQHRVPPAGAEYGAARQLDDRCLL